MRPDYFKFLFYSICLCLTFQYSLAQGEPVQNPSASGLTRSVDYPVDNSTGLPDISIPLYSMPTRSKNIAINVGLSYHPSAVASYNEHMGDCGRGWTLIKGGAITRQCFKPCDIVWKHQKKLNEDYNNNRPADEPEQPLVYTTEPADVFTFNFMGFSGKFKIKRYGSNLIANVIENKGNPIRIDISFISSSNDIMGFTIYDDKGYKYVFSLPDTYLVIMSAQASYTGKSAFHLQYITDNNNNTLAEFGYKRFEQDNPGYSIKNINFANNKIESFGIGVMEFSNISYPNVNDISGFRYTGFNVKDVMANAVRSFNFTFDIHGKLIKLSEFGMPGSKVQSHTFGYEQKFSNGYDKWGYPNVNKEQCDYNDVPVDDAIRLNTAANGVLNKIVTPTGSCVIYNYELNTYSYDLHRGLDIFKNDQSPDYQINYEFFFNYELPGNRHNFNPNEYTINFDASNHTRYVSAGSHGTYFRFYANPVTMPVQDGGGSTAVYPSFTVTKGNFSKTFWVNEDNYCNSYNYCAGFKDNSNNGTFTVSTGSNGTHSVIAMRPVLKPAEELNKLWYGGGIRIRNIQYFSDENTATQNRNNPEDEAYRPVRQINYNYNLFDEPNRSSGSLLTDYRNIVYRNVTVSEAGKGKTQYTYYIPNDFFDDYESYKRYDYRLGQIKDKKIFDNAGNPLQETVFAYDFSDYETINPGNSDFNSNVGGSLGWIALRQVKNKTFYPEGVIETIDEYQYYSNKKLLSHTSSSSRSSEVLRTEYSYHIDNALNSQNRMELSETRNYRNSELLSKSVINYNNNFDNNTYGGFMGMGMPYYPSTIASAKGSSALEQKLRFNVYDVYGHLLESEQENGSKTVYIYGYNNTQVIAKIENSIAYSAIPAALINEAKAASDGTDEALLLTKLTALRNHSLFTNAFITTYTHKRLIGVSTVTDARGYKTSYGYDAFGRLKAVKDADGNTLTETEYNLIPQN